MCLCLSKEITDGLIPTAGSSPITTTVIIVCIQVTVQHVIFMIRRSILINLNYCCFHINWRLFIKTRPRQIIKKRDLLFLKGVGSWKHRNLIIFYKRWFMYLYNSQQKYRFLGCQNFRNLRQIVQINWIFEKIFQQTK